MTASQLLGSGTKLTRSTIQTSDNQEGQEKLGSAADPARQVVYVGEDEEELRKKKED